MYPVGFKTAPYGFEVRVTYAMGNLRDTTHWAIGYSLPCKTGKLFFFECNCATIVDGFEKSPILPRHVNISDMVLCVALVMAAYRKYASLLGHRMPYLELFKKLIT